MKFFKCSIALKYLEMERSKNLNNPVGEKGNSKRQNLKNFANKERTLTAVIIDKCST